MAVQTRVRALLRTVLKVAVGSGLGAIVFVICTSKPASLNARVSSEYQFVTASAAQPSLRAIVQTVKHDLPR